jgi:simple sugar transport system permease protein
MKRLLPGTLFWPVVAWVLVLLFNVVFTSGFAHVEFRDGRLYGSLIDILDRAAPVMLVSLGMTLVIATGGVDLSVGAVMSVVGAVAAGLVSRPGYSILSRIDLGDSFALVLLVSLAAGTCAGLWNGLLVAVLEVQPIVATLILMVAGRGIAQLLTSGQIISFNNPAFEFLGNGTFVVLPFSITLVLAAFVLTWLLTRRTALGLFVEAVGNNPVASHFAGINTRMVKWFVYALCGLCAGLAGLIVASNIKAADANNAGMYLELDAILAVVLGGTPLIGGRFSLAGSLVGALLIQSVTTTILTRGIPVEYTLVLKALVILGVCLLQSEEFRRTVRRRFQRS